MVWESHGNVLIVFPMLVNGNEKGFQSRYVGKDVIYREHNIPADSPHNLHECHSIYSAEGMIGSNDVSAGRLDEVGEGKRVRG